MSVPSPEDSGATAPAPERGPHAATKAERQAARARVGAYHEAELAKLIERVREGLGRYDVAELDAFELDDLIHRYERATQKLWGFCVGYGGPAVAKARTLDFAEQEGELPDWWAAGEPRRGS